MALRIGVETQVVALGEWWVYRKGNKSGREDRRVFMLLLLSRFSRVRLCTTPWTAAHQAPPSLGFCRQEHWSGLPFPSPMHEKWKWKWSRSVLSDSQRPHGPRPTRLLRPWDFPGKSTGVGCHCLLWGCSQRGINMVVRGELMDCGVTRVFEYLDDGFKEKNAWKHSSSISIIILIYHCLLN